MWLLTKNTAAIELFFLDLFTDIFLFLFLHLLPRLLHALQVHIRCFSFAGLVLRRGRVLAIAFREGFGRVDIWARLFLEIGTKLDGFLLNFHEIVECLFDFVLGGWLWKKSGIIIKYKVLYNLRYFRISLLCKTAIKATLDSLGLLLLSLRTLAAP